MHPAIQILADKYGVKLSNRVCGGYDLQEPCFNGKDIATREIRLFDAMGEKTYCFGREGAYRQAFPLSDHDILHEIAHYAVASKEQRMLPEYGLGSILPGIFDDSILLATINEEEADIQEALAQLLCCYWGEKYNINPSLSGSKGYASTWDEYLLKKAVENIASRGSDIFWKALIYVRKLMDEGNLD